MADMDSVLDALLPSRWKSDSPGVGSILGLLALAAYASWFMHSTGWVPLMDGTSLLIHEAGHPIAAIISEKLMVYGGSIFQVGFPLIFAGYFRREGQSLGAVFCLIWDAAAWHNLGVYVDDARSMGLPLVGNGDRIHDWNEILGRWNALAYDHALGSSLWFFSWAMMICALAMLINLWTVRETEGSQ